MQVHLPLVEMPVRPETSVVPVQVAPPAPVPAAAVAPEAPVELSDEPEADAPVVPAGVDRKAVMAGAVAGFLGGLVSGAGISIFLG